MKIVSATEQLLRRPEVERLTGLPCSTLYRLMAAGQFPKQIRIAAGSGARAVAWRASAVQEWIETRR